MFSHTGGCLWLCHQWLALAVSRSPFACRSEGTPANTDRGMNAEDERAVEHVLNTAFEVHSDGKTFDVPSAPASNPYHLLRTRVSHASGKSSSAPLRTHPLRGLPRRMTSQRSSRRPRPAMT